MDYSIPIRDLHQQTPPNPCAMCRSARSSSNSFPFCTCKTTSYLHIPQPLQPACLPQFAEFSGLTHLLCADTTCTGRGGRYPASKANSPLSLLPLDFSSSSLATSSESYCSKTKNLKCPRITF